MIAQRLKKGNIPLKRMLGKSDTEAQGRVCRPGTGGGPEL